MASAVSGLRTTKDELSAVRAEARALVADGFSVEWRGPDELPPAAQRWSHGGIFHPGDGALDQGAWIRCLAALAHEAGAEIAEETRATALDGTRVETEHGVVTADVVLVATDGYTDGLVPELDAAVESIRGQVVATEPVESGVIPCPLYGRWGYDYAQQLPDGRVVAGGRRDLDLVGETGLEEATNDLIQGGLETLLAELLGATPPITHRWAGIMGFTQDYLPLVGPLPGRENVWVSAGYSGHGNVMGFACGEAVAAVLLGEEQPWLEPFSPGRTPAAPPPG